jgi:hypothetical protein
MFLHLALKDFYNLMDEKIEHRAVIKFLSNRDIIVVEIHHRLLREFREYAYILSSICEWIRAFKMGAQGFWENIAPDDRSSITSTPKVSHCCSKTIFRMFARLPKSRLSLSGGSTPDELTCSDSSCDRHSLYHIYS